MTIDDVDSLLKTNGFSDEEIAEIKADPQAMAILKGELENSAPSEGVRDSLLKFFRDVLSFGNSDFDKISKTGNLKDFEIGSIKTSVRDYLNIANFCSSEGLDSVADYIRGKSNIIVNTSLSRNAKFLQLVVTQRKLSGVIEPKSVETKKGLFGEVKVERGGDDL